MYINYTRSAQSVTGTHQARLASVKFVDFADDFWLEWIDDSAKLSAAVVAETASSVLKLHPSPRALAHAITVLPILVAADWNDWSVFTPRPTALKSAVRYVETAIEQVGLWCDTESFWSSVRDFYASMEPNNSEAVRRILTRQIKAVPMPHDKRKLLSESLKEFELSHGLTSSPMTDSVGEKIWNSWSSLEIRAQTDPSSYLDMIQKRKAIDPPEYIRSLHARSVFADPHNINYWLEYARFQPSEAVGILSRGVRNNPYSGILWLELVMAQSTKKDDPSLHEVLMMGISALRDSPTKDPDCLHALLMAEICLQRNNGNSSDELRTLYQNGMAIMQEVNSPKHVASVLISWITFEMMVNPEFAASIIEQYVSEGEEWRGVRTAMTPLQWVQLANLSRMHGLDESLTRKIYTVALELVADKYKSIILNDQVTFEEVAGRMTDVLGIRKKLIGMEKSADSTTVKDTRKRNRPIEVEEKQPPVEPPPEVILHNTRFVFMRDIPFNVTDENVGDFLDKDCGVGKPVQILIVRDEKGKSRGFGYAEFDSVQKANAAIKKSGTKLKSRNVIILPSDREITVKRDRPQHVQIDRYESIPAETTKETDVRPKDNEYFRNLIARKQKGN